MIPTEKQEETILALSKVLEATRERKIQWTRANPTTFSFLQANTRAIIQRTEQMKQTIDLTTKRVGQVKLIAYIFQLVILPSNAQVLTINSTEDKFAEQILSELYSAVDQALASQGLDLLKKLIP